MAKEVFITINSNSGEAVKSVQELSNEVKLLSKQWKETEDVIARNKIGERLKGAKTELTLLNNTVKDGKSFTDKLGDSIGVAIKQQLGFNLAMLASPIGIITALVGVFKLLYDKLESVRAVFKAITTFFTTGSV